MARTAVRLAVRTLQAYANHNGSDSAATVAYYSFLSMFPLILGIAALFSLFLPSEDVQRELFDFLQRVSPGSAGFLERNISRIMSMRGATGALGIIVLFWSGSAMFGAASRAINRAWGIPHDRPFFLSKLRDLAMALGVGAVLALSLVLTGLSTVFGDMVLSVRSLPFDIGARTLLFLFSSAIFLTVYKFAPNARIRWGSVWPGALVAAALTELVRNLFITYVRSFADFQSVYGSLASAIALLVWIYVSTIVIILGAELNCQWTRMRQAQDAV
ncbi:MAG: YihY/virulence factor BrkB family protein [Chloroflexi bacterium]|nr:YihY/virulence factor BrkB family protein [Chloroflexota bacterium]